MCAAHDEIDQIHETEKAAQERIEKAQKQARKIHEDADDEAKRIIETAEIKAKDTAAKMLRDIEGRKGEIESSVFKKTEKTIEKLQGTAEQKKDKAYQAVVKILLGEA
ncbi:MAG: V-type ATPase subunit subunit G family protein [Candidatus Thorarchaeota archaeon]|jgi:vacuolar-type H+-ATPase subunit H